MQLKRCGGKAMQRSPSSKPAEQLQICTGLQSYCPCPREAGRHRCQRSASRKSQPLIASSLLGADLLQGLAVILWHCEAVLATHSSSSATCHTERSQSRTTPDHRRPRRDIVQHGDGSRARADRVGLWNVECIANNWLLDLAAGLLGLQVFADARGGGECAQEHECAPACAAKGGWRSQAICLD